MKAKKHSTNHFTKKPIHIKQLETTTLKVNRNEKKLHKTSSPLLPASLKHSTINFSKINKLYG